jgi:hypothetical protein
MGISLLPEDVESVKIIGSLNGKEVKLIRTFGGFHIAVGKKNKYGKDVEALSAGSHPGLVNYKIMEEFEDFEPLMAKSEGEIQEEICDYSEILPNEIRNDGLEMFSLGKGEDITFVVTKYGVDIRKIEAQVDSQDKALLLNKGISNPQFSQLPYNHVLLEHIVFMMNEEAHKRGLEKIVNNED